VAKENSVARELLLESGEFQQFMSDISELVVDEEVFEEVRLVAESYFQGLYVDRRG